jgi:hypothetical protein
MVEGLKNPLAPDGFPGASTLRTWAPAAIVVAVFAPVLSLAACSVQKTASGWFGATPTPSPPQATAAVGQVYYAAVGGLRMYSEPASSSKLVGKLSLHEKVTRHRIERGYAQVTSDTTGLTGWVDNAKLLWRLPAATPERAGPPGTPAEPVGEEPRAAPTIPATPEAQEPTPTPTGTPGMEATPAPSGVVPSLFDPY